MTSAHDQIPLIFEGPPDSKHLVCKPYLGRCSFDHTELGELLGALVIWNTREGQTCRRLPHDPVPDQ